MTEPENFEQDIAFLQRHTKTIVLSSMDGNARIALAPELQGRVMTSTSQGNAGHSFGWINYALFEKGILPVEQRKGLEAHVYAFGGEERLWFGPEGGQYSLYFSPDSPNYDFEHWITPELINTEAFDVTPISDQEVSFSKSASLINKAGTCLNMDISRTVTLIDRPEISTLLDLPLSADLDVVAFRTQNSVTNTGSNHWTKSTGLPSIWLLGMLRSSQDTTLAIPFKKGDNLGNKVNTDYFGPVDEQRLKTNDKVSYFKGDGDYRAKIGIPAARALPYAGSYAPDTKTLTLIHFNLLENATELPYVRSQWEHHDAPYAGDVLNAYNDGPAEPGADALGAFYELESSSPALELGPKDSYTHIQETIHFTGNEQDLNAIAQKTLGVSIEEIVNAFS
jgi:hypothetical protein